jgi:hypothetical protein
MSKQFKPKISEIKKCYTGGGHKSAKKCHILFEWPLTKINYETKYWGYAAIHIISCGTLLL